MKISSGSLPVVSNRYGKRPAHSRPRREEQSCEPIPNSSLDMIFAEHKKSPIFYNKTKATIQRKEEQDMILGEG